MLVFESTKLEGLIKKKNEQTNKQAENTNLNHKLSQSKISPCTCCGPVEIRTYGGRVVVEIHVRRLWSV